MKKYMTEKITFPHRYERLVYREFEHDDIVNLLQFTDDPSQLKFMTLDLTSKEDAYNFHGYLMSEAGKDNRNEWHLALENDSGFIGSVALMIEKDAPSSAELGYWFRRSAWGKGYATEASRFMLDFGFKTLGMHRIWGKCHVENAASANVMKKIGMLKEGVVREHLWLRDHFRSSYLFSILENEYK